MTKQDHLIHWPRLALPAIFSLSLLVLASCVSVSLAGKPKLERAQVSFRPPNSPFRSVNSASADQAWKNPKSGNSVAYFSSCNDPADPSLELVRRELVSGIQNLQFRSSEIVTFNGREALRSLVSGQVDGVEAQMDILIFKKNQCTFGITYVGLSSRFAEDKPVFEDFLLGFVAP